MGNSPTFTKWQKNVVKFICKCSWILKQSLSFAELVRRNAEERLIPVWFRAYKDKLCRFFKDLRQGSESLDNLMFISKLLKVLSKCVKIAQIVEEIDLDFDR